jgi:hypothetical protein
MRTPRCDGLLIWQHWLLLFPKETNVLRDDNNYRVGSQISMLPPVQRLFLEEDNVSSFSLLFRIMKAGEVCGVENETIVGMTKIIRITRPRSSSLECSVEARVAEPEMAPGRWIYA